MATDSKRFLHPEAIKRIARLDLRARHIVEGFLSGMHRSPYFGQSVEFLQHREYAPATTCATSIGKSGPSRTATTSSSSKKKPTSAARCLVDVSQQHGVRQRADEQIRIRLHGRRAAWRICCLRQQDAVGCVAFDEAIAHDRAASHQAQPSEFDHSRARPPASRERRPTSTPILRGAAEAYPRRGMMVLISDLLVERPGLIKGLKLLRQRGHDVLVFHVLDDDELDFPFAGPTRFEGLEMPDHLTCNPRALREGYLAALNAYLEEIRRDCSQNGVDYTLVRTSDPLDAVLAHFISARQRTMRKR